MADKKKYYAHPNKPTPGMPVVFDEKLCNGCNKCVDICTTDVLVENPIKGQSPIVLFPEECWYAGCCIGECPSGAIKLNHPMMSRVRWKRKDTGEHFRV
jgi:NAD-dependent dihydropyrimidine dehydrogenase PreA subunit